MGYNDVNDILQHFHFNILELCALVRLKGKLMSYIFHKAILVNTEE